jgi:hypothetical protein
MGPHKSERRSCPGCGTEIDALRWSRLAVAVVVNRGDLGRVLSVEVSWTVEVRRCPCGRLVASKQAPPPSEACEPLYGELQNAHTRHVKLREVPGHDGRFDATRSNHRSEPVAHIVDAQKLACANGA